MLHTLVKSNHESLHRVILSFILSVIQSAEATTALRAGSKWNAGDNPLEIKPPGENPPQYLQNDWLERHLRIIGL